MKECTLIFPHQLFAQHPAHDRSRVPVLVEDSLFFGDAAYPARFHQQKLIFHRAAMKAYEARLARSGPAPQYIEYDPAKTARDIVGDLAAKGCRSIYWAEPPDDILSRRVRRGCKEHGIALHTYASPMFLTPPAWGLETLGDETPYRMQPFYIAQRKRMDLLLSNGRPRGGAWSHDQANRKRWPRTRGAPPIPTVRPNAYVREAQAYIAARFPNNPGHAKPFAYPVTHRAARHWLDGFLDERLTGFGTYEDAMARKEPLLHHSMLSPLLNAGLLTPDEVLQAALDRAERKPVVPLNDLEGFVRQLIGWREYMMLLYHKIGVAQRNANFWNHTSPLPDAFYHARTGLAPVDAVIQGALDRAYNHHIERLMILGNIFLLCEIEPHAVYRWFMEMYIDAYDWVMVPNVYGMSQFADGGWLCTKPYISSSNYIRKMSDFPAGPWCAIWDGLFWRFIHKHRAFFNRQPRLSMMARQWDRLPAAKQKQHLQNAETYLAELHGK